MMMTVEAAAKEYRIGLPHLRRLLAEGHLVTCVEVRPQGDPVERIDPTDLDRYFAKHPHTLLQWQQENKTL